MAENTSSQRLLQPLYTLFSHLYSFIAQFTYSYLTLSSFL
nr:MAG TPA: hypothetical protein [Crassvirales sp.]